jgi:predicted double-glycine peptidase
MGRHLWSMAAALLASCVWQPLLHAQQKNSPAGPRQVMGHVVAGRTTQTIAVRSLRDLRFKDMVQQQQDFSCGAAVLATLLQQVYGRAISEADVIADMLENADPQVAKSQGFSLLDMKSYVERRGLRGHGYVVDRASLRAIKIPVIALQNNGGYKHFVIIKKVLGDTVFIADPALGHREMVLDDFLNGWNNIVFAVVGEGLQSDNALTVSAQPLAQLQRASIVTRALPQQHQFGLLGIDTF